MAVMPRFCGRCGAQLPPGAPYCGRCGTPVGAQMLAAQPVYSYPVAPQVAYPARGGYRLSQVAIAGGLLAVLAIVTVVVTAIAVTRFTGGSHAPCVVNCAPKIVTALPEGATYHSSAWGYALSYSSRWTVRSQDANGIVIGTNMGQLQVEGMQAADNAQVLRSTIAALPSAKWQNVTLVSNLKGAHIGDQDGIGSVYAANLIGGNSAATAVRLAVIVATRGNLTIAMLVADPADTKNFPNGIPEGQLFDYVATEFAWPG